jgi:uncharacterized protein (DUF1015 family)
MVALVWRNIKEKIPLLLLFLRGVPLADVRPFVCCRPRPELASEVAALPYDVFSRREAAQEIAAHPHSFLRIDKTAALFADEVDEYDARVYARAADLLAADERAGVYLCEDAPRYFLYRLIKDGRAQTGVVACIATSEYHSGVLRRHENTRSIKLEDRIRHISALRAQTGPVFVTYRAQEAIDAAVAQLVAATEPLYDFVAPDGVRHTVWRVDCPDAENTLREGFAALDALDIADGHHRAAAAAALGAPLREAGASSREAGAPLRDGDDSFLVIAFPSDQLEVLDYNRVVFDTQGLSRDELLARIAERFDIEGEQTEPCRPRRKGEFALYLGGLWYRLSVHEDLRPSDPVDGLDVSLLQDYLLAPILGIGDPRSDRRIAYVGGVRGLEELKRRVDAVDAATTAPATTPAGPCVAFALYPSSLDELFAVADAGRLMPPKSTWFEPKPRSGLFVHKIDCFQEE